MSGIGVLNTDVGAASASARELRWMALGDSFTAGIDPGERTWASLVRGRVDGLRPPALINLAKAGATIGEIEREQLPLALGSRPDLVTLICGGNDVIGTVRPREDEFAADLDRIFARLTDGLPGTRLLTATYPPIAAHALRPRTRRRVIEGMAALNSIIRSTAARHRFTCVEMANHPGRADDGNYADDGIHPSAAGHRAAAAVLEPAIEALLNDNRKEHR